MWGEHRLTEESPNKIVDFQRINEEKAKEFNFNNERAFLIGNVPVDLTRNALKFLRNFYCFTYF
jgi:hypothetical protein